MSHIGQAAGAEWFDSQGAHSFATQLMKERARGDGLADTGASAGDEDNGGNLLRSACAHACRLNSLRGILNSLACLLRAFLE
jgi:hypothetical protein